jgi:DNA polymerase III alpha subunit (gram-positive type)
LKNINPSLRWKNWRELNIGIIDTETTSLDTGAEDFHIIQFAGILVSGNTVMDSINIFIHPGMLIPEKVTKITGITDADVEGKPAFKEAIDSIYGFMLKADLLCAFNHVFDSSGLATEFSRAGYPVISTPYLDPLIWEKEKRSRGNTQGEVAKRYGCGRMGRSQHGDGSLHNALVDVEVLWDIVKAMSETLPHSYEDLIETQTLYQRRQEAYREKLNQKKAAPKKKK